MPDRTGTLDAAGTVTPSASARVAPRSSTPTERARVASGTSGAFITETLERFPTLTAARLFDMMKSVVLERRGDAIRFHPALLELAAHYRFEPRPVAPVRGNEKTCESRYVPAMANPAHDR